MDGQAPKRMLPLPVFDRRRLLIGTASTLAAAGSYRHVHAHRVNQGSVEAYAPVSLDAREIETLKAVTERLIPTDATGPGAIEAGVFIYIDEGLASHLAPHLQTYRDGLRALDAAASPSSFTELSPVEQDRIITALQQDQVPAAPRGFFVTLLTHTREGMFSDPVHGGNVGFAGWDLIGYPGVKLVWTEQEQALDVPVPPAHTSASDLGRARDD